MLIDAHVHLDLYESELPEILKSIERRRILTVAVALDPDSYLRSREAAGVSGLILPAFGIHPEEAHLWFDRLDEVDELIEEAPMIGEIGLDRRWVTEPEKYEPQRIVFDHFLRRAAESDRVLNIHTAGAEAECLERIVEAGCQRVIVHWYSGPLDILSDMVAAGFYFTVGVELALSNTIQDVVAAIPDDRLLTETDNPGGLEWLTGERGMPEHLTRVVDELARRRHEKPGEVEKLVSENMARLFGDDLRLEPWAALLGE